MMKLAHIATVLVVPAALALNATPCLAPYIPYTPEHLVPQCEMIALFEVVNGNVAPDTIFQAPPDARRDFDFHILPTVTLRVIEPVQGCRDGDVLEVESPRVADQGGPPRMAPRLPVFLNDGQQALGFLREQDGEHVGVHVILVGDGLLEVEFEEEYIHASGSGRRAHKEQLPVADALHLVAEAVRKWNESQAYELAAKTSAQLLDDYGDSKWLNDRIIEDLKARGDVHGLGTLLEKADDVAKRRIARVLGQIPGPEPVPYLLALLHGPHPGLWGSAIGGLARFEGEPAVPRLIELLDERDPHTGIPRYLTSVAAAMVAIDDPGGIDAVLKAATDPRTAMILSGTIRALAKSPRPMVEAFLLKRAREPMEVWIPPDEYPGRSKEGREREYQYEIMIAAAKALAGRGSEVGFERLRELLQEWQAGEPALRIFAKIIITALGELGDTRSVPMLIEVVAEWNEDPYSGAGAAFGALITLRDRRAIAPLIRAVETAPDESRFWMVRSIGKWDDPDIRAFLVAELNGPDRLSMSAAALALHQLGVANSADRLLALMEKGLDGWEREERYWLYWTLHEMKERRAIPGLIAAMRTDSENRSAIGWMLREIAGTDLPDDAELWQNWWDRRRE